VFCSVYCNHDPILQDPALHQHACRHHIHQPVVGPNIWGLVAARVRCSLFIADVIGPGCTPQVTFEPETRMLSIAGKRANEHSETDEAGRFSRLERRFGAFQRRFKLPQNVDTGAISAKVRG
jgi:Hsp20/alpha crystallin family